MTVYTDLFNEAIDDLATTLATISGLRVVTDPQKINPPCIFLDAPSWESFNYNIVKMIFNVKVLSLGPSNFDALRAILSISADLLAKNVAVTAGRPATLTVGGVDYPCYDVDISLQAQTG